MAQLVVILEKEGCLVQDSLVFVLCLRARLSTGSTK